MFLILEHTNKITIMIIFRKNKIIIVGMILVYVICLSRYKPNQENIIQTSTRVSKYEILVDVEESKLYLFQDGELNKTYKCSGGKWSTPSPIGTWKIVSKAKWGEGFGGSWMGLNVPWGQFGIHGTLDSNSLGWPSSHGCIRMENSEVAELYKIIPIGTKVTIVDGQYGAFGKGFRNLKSGMYGSDVLEIQKKLKEQGFFNGTPNGKFGSATEEAVKKYCNANNLYVRKTIDIELQENMGFILFE